MAHFKQGQLVRWSYKFPLAWVIVLLLWTSRAIVSTAEYQNYISPTTEAVIVIGESLNLTCSYPLECESAWFQKEDYNIKDHVRLPVISSNDTRMITLPIINGTKDDEAFYICRCEKTDNSCSRLDDKYVYVIKQPTNVTFSCVYYDFKEIICSFVPNERVKYKLNYTTKADQMKRCQLTTKEGETKQFCNITSTDLLILQDDYTFYLYGTYANNRHINQEIKMKMFDYLRPSTIQNVKMNVKEKSVKISWSLSKYYFYLADIGYRIRVTPRNFNAKTIWYPYVATINDIEYYDLSLEYANWLYTIEISCRNMKSKNTTLDGTSLWSDWYVTQIKTRKQTPEKAPTSAAGAYYRYGNDATKKITFYWQELQLTDFNGDELSYGYSIDDSPIITTNSSESFVTLSLEGLATKAYSDIHINAQNEVGRSDRSSHIRYFHVKGNHIQYVPTKVHSFTFNGNYTLTWQPPDHLVGLQNYTILWCKPKFRTQDECDGRINFGNGSNESKEYIISGSTDLNVAVAANYDDYSTGLQWSTCVADLEKELPKFNLETRTESSQAIYVELRADKFICPSAVKMMNVTYCDEAAHCSHYNLTTFETKFRIEKLRPFTTYDIFVTLIPKNENISTSYNSVSGMTSQGVPSAPQNLTALEITNTTAHLSWLAPAQPNGLIKYIVGIRKVGTNIIVSSEMTQNTSANIPDLQSFTKYEATITAITCADCQNSTSIEFKTAIGTPSEPQNVDWRNEYELVWKPPSNPAGEVQYYLVAEQLYRDGECKEQLSLVKNSTEIFTQTDCATQKRKTVKVAAVNIDSNSNMSHTNDNDNKIDKCMWTADTFNNPGCTSGDIYTNCLMDKFPNAKIYMSEWKSTTNECRLVNSTKLNTFIFSLVPLILVATILFVYFRKQQEEKNNITPIFPEKDKDKDDMEKPAIEHSIIQRKYELHAHGIENIATDFSNGSVESLGTSNLVNLKQSVSQDSLNIKPSEKNGYLEIGNVKINADNYVQPPSAKGV